MMTAPPRTAIALSIIRSTDAGAECRLYERLRAPEFSSLGLSPEALGSLLGMQFAAQSAQVSAEYPNAVRELVVADGVVVARLITASEPSTLRLVDIAVLPELRGVGIGTRVLGIVADRADLAGQRIQLSAWNENTGAIRLYERLGYLPGESTGGYLTLTRPVGASIPERTA